MQFEKNLCEKIITKAFGTIDDERLYVTIPIGASGKYPTLKTRVKWIRWTLNSPLVNTVTETVTQGRTCASERPSPRRQRTRLQAIEVIETLQLNYQSDL